MTREQWKIIVVCVIFWPLMAGYGVATVHLSAVIYWKITTSWVFILPDPGPQIIGMVSALIVVLCAIYLLINIYTVLFKEARDNPAPNRSKTAGSTPETPPTNNTRGPDGRPIPPHGGSGVSPPPGARRP